jgi:hypothetical protein
MDFLAWVGAAFLFLGLAGWVGNTVSRYGPSLRRWFSGSLSRFRLYCLERRVNALARRHGYRRAPSLGQLRVTRTRAKEFSEIPDVHGDGEHFRRHLERPCMVGRMVKRRGFIYGKWWNPFRVVDTDRRRH